MITNIRTKNSWFNYTCTLGKCRKGVTPNQKGSFWCESCSTEVSYPRPRYRIQADITDGTADVVVVLFDETTEKLDDSGDSYVMPPVLQQLIGTSHIFEIKSHTYYQVADYESFNCSQVVAELYEPAIKKEDKKSISSGNESVGSTLAKSNVTQSPVDNSDAEATAVVMKSD
uniref:uncharacterized protein LOC122601020 n=1 Tax=Erigeron canadensis TaxID=72917 RepID=UPI001CB94547|nr:uncharacterized protein LOC122601020 [Erigeron canadensis]